MSLIIAPFTQNQDPEQVTHHTAAQERLGVPFPFVTWNKIGGETVCSGKAPTSFPSFLSLQSDVIRKPQGQVELNSRCQIVRGEGAQTFQVSMVLAVGVLDRRGTGLGCGSHENKDGAR